MSRKVTVENVSKVPPKPFVQIAVTSDPDAEDYAVYALDAGGRVVRRHVSSLTDLGSRSMTERRCPMADALSSLFATIDAVPRG